MPRGFWPLWGLLGMALSLDQSIQGSHPHSLRYFYVVVSEPVQGLPHFSLVGYVDGQPFVHYDSNTRKIIPQVFWIKEVEKEDPQYWDRNTQRAQHNEIEFRESVNILRIRFNQTGGIHAWQRMVGCELRGDGSKGGYSQYGYDGRDFIAFDQETLTWTAAIPQAQLTKRKWDADRTWNRGTKFYLEEICIEWLQKYLHYGNKTLLRKGFAVEISDDTCTSKVDLVTHLPDKLSVVERRTEEQPKVKVTSKVDHDNMETLFCRADGFYPRDIEIVWTRDGKVWEQETLHGLVAPNSDGTYHSWISTKIDTKDKDRFRCRVDHSSWKDPVDFTVEKPVSAFISLQLIIFGSILLVPLFAGILVYLRKQQDRYEAALSDGSIFLRNRQQEGES